MGAIEHDNSGTGDGGEHPSFRRAERSGTYRANGDQTGILPESELSGSSRRGWMRVGGEPALEDYG